MFLEYTTETTERPPQSSMPQPIHNTAQAIAAGDCPAPVGRPGLAISTSGGLHKETGA